MTDQPSTEAGRESDARRVGRIISDDQPRCPTCGHAVHIQPTDNGSYYEPDEREVEADLRARGWQDEYEVETAAAMNFGEGQAQARATERQRVAALEGMLRLVRATPAPTDEDGACWFCLHDIDRFPGHNEGCPYALLEASPAPEPRPAPLDVERLARAIVRADSKADAPLHSLSARQAADAYAREYAELKKV